MKAKICVIIFIKLNSVAPIHKTKIVPLQGIELICTKMDLSGDYNEGGWGWNDGVGGSGLFTGQFTVKTTHGYSERLDGTQRVVEVHGEYILCHASKLHYDVLH